MNKLAHYNGFVGRCQQYGLTKQAADMLYKRAADAAAKADSSAKSVWDTIKGRWADIQGSWAELSPAQKKALIGGGAGLLTGGVVGALLDPRARFRNALIGALIGTPVGAGVGYGTDKAIALWNARNKGTTSKV